MHRFTNTRGIELIKHFEGYSSTAYICPGGYNTIGYGHKIKPGENFTNISPWQAEDLLVRDLYYAERAVIKYIDSSLYNNQFDPLVSFTFNLGVAALQRSTLRQKINYGLHNECHDEFLRWSYARGRKLPGLIKRRNAESKLFSNEITHMVF